MPGDRLRQVHWRATARLGELVVKEAEEPRAPVLHLVLDLGAGDDAGEVAAGRAAWWSGDALRRGYQLVLTTVEAERTVTAPAHTPAGVNHRLARATAGSPAVPPVARPARLLIVGPDGDAWP